MGTDQPKKRKIKNLGKKNLQKKEKPLDEHSR